MSKKKFDPTDTKEMTDELDQSAFFRPQPLPHSSTPTPPPSANAELQEPVIADLQNSANEEMQNSANAELQKVEIQRAALRKTYAKTSYRLCPEAFDAIEAAKRLLDRKFGIRASREDIAEIALMVVHEDLEKNGEQSELVKRLSAILQKQK
jgi:hypothetical protein